MNFDITSKHVGTVTKKELLSPFMVENLPTYKIFVELKADKISNIIPSGGVFHQQMYYIYAIYNRLSNPTFTNASLFGFSFIRKHESNESEQVPVIASHANP